MYYPYFRGKTYELIAIRENAELFSDNSFIPIIEPVKESISGLERALNVLIEHNARFILITNPGHGDFSRNGKQVVSGELKEKLEKYEGYVAGYILNEGTTEKDAAGFIDGASSAVALVHAGFNNAKQLAMKLKEKKQRKITHVFIEKHCGDRYRSHFKDAPGVLIQDGFNKQKNRDYPKSEMFSELYLTFSNKGVTGFGDYLIVGDDFSEGGGPAYAIAIHLTYISRENDDVMWVNHYISDTQDTPTDPAGKFYEALTKLSKDAKRKGSEIFQSKAVLEYLELYENQHYPGLGYVKKLSMQHHLELMEHALKGDEV